MSRRAIKKRWVPHSFVKRIVKILRASVKRQMTGESRRQWIERNLQDSQAGVAIDLVQCLLGLMMTAAIIDQNWAKSNYNHSTTYFAIDVLNFIAIAFNLGIRFYSASNRRTVLVHWLSIVDTICFAPLFLEVLTIADYTSKYFVRLLLIARATRLLQLYRLLRLAHSAKTRQLMTIVLTITCIIICSAVAIQAIEYCGDNSPDDEWYEDSGCQALSFVDAMYFVCITMTTVGFGDVAPRTSTGKVFDMALIVFAGVLIPLQISGYSNILSRETAFDKRFVPKPGVQHVLICGDVDHGALLFFLHDWLYREREFGLKQQVIILSPTLPAPDLKRILIQPEYEQRVIYLQGSAMVAADLLRASTPSAECCFVMVKKHSYALDQNDTAANLITCSVRKNNKHIPLYVQVSKFDNIRHVHISGASAVVCIEQIKLAMLGKGMWIRGLNAFVSNLLLRYAPIDDKGNWMTDYLNGCSHQIYEAFVPPCLLTMQSFRALALLIYREFGVPLVGVRTVHEVTQVYPVDDALPNVPIQSVFFIGKSREIIAKIERLTPAVFVRHQDIHHSIDVSQHRSARKVVGIFNAIDNKIPFRKLSVILADSTRRPASRIFRISEGTSIATARGSIGVEKVAPINDDDTTLPNHGITGQNRRPNGPFHDAPHLQPRLSNRVDEDDENPVDNLDGSLRDSSKPVVALSPAELIKKATSPPSARGPTREPVMMPLSSRTPRSTQEPEDALSKSETSVSDLQAPYPRQPESINTPPQSTSVPRLGTPTPVSGPPVESIIPAIYARRESWRALPIVRRTSAIIAAKTTAMHLRKGSTNTLLPSGYPPVELTNHFVVCGTPSSYLEFLQNLSDLNDKADAVVFVTPRQFTDKDVEVTKLEQKIYFVQGSPLSMSTFYASRMLFARSILILARCGDDSAIELAPDVEDSDENMVDVDAITTHRFVSEALHNVQVQQAAGSTKAVKPFLVVEMIRPSNVKFLADYTGSLYNIKTNDHQQRARILGKEAKCLDTSMLNPLYASGHIFFSNLMDAFIGASGQQPMVANVLIQLITSGNMSMQHPDHEMRSRHRLTQMVAPQRYHFRPYALMVEAFLLSEGVMILGMYRGGNSQTAPSFVLTNPSGDELVSPHDLLFIIK